MQSSDSERIGIFVDWLNLSSAAQFLGFELDRERLQHLQPASGEQHTMYFMAICEEIGYVRVRPMVDWLDYDHFALVTEPAQQGERSNVRWGLGIARVVDAELLAKNLDHVILFSGQGESRDLAATLRQMRKRVSLVLTVQAQLGGIAAELRRQADRFMDIQELGIITREASARWHCKSLASVLPQ